MIAENTMYALRFMKRMKQLHEPEVGLSHNSDAVEKGCIRGVDISAVFLHTLRNSIREDGLSLTHEMICAR